MTKKNLSTLFKNLTNKLLSKSLVTLLIFAMIVGTTGMYALFYPLKSYAGFSATGGTITYSNGNTIHTFTSNGTFTPTEAGTVEVLVVAGGGGGGAAYGGGGGGGGVIYNSSFAVTAQAYSITVGAGGAGSPASNTANRATNGGNSVFSSLTAIGGGGGVGYLPQNAQGSSGGSGGGGTYGGSGGSGTSGQGNAGGSGFNGTNYGGGGGGGAGGSGGNGTSTTGGAGGTGLAYSISGTSVFYGGGGGGGTYQGGTAGAGGSGGGGAGGSGSGNNPGINGTANTGGGGGGSGYLNSTPAGGDGGSGIVIISYSSASGSPWTQTDWSGGTSSGGATTANPTTNYAASGASNVSHATSGQIGLNAPEKFTNTGFETNLTGWNVPFSSHSRGAFGTQAFAYDDDSFSFGNGTTDQPFSFSVWAKKTAANNYLFFPTKGNFQSGDQAEYAINLIGGTLYFNLYDITPSCCSYLNVTYAIPLSIMQNNWMHVVGTYDGSGTGAGQKLYINGVYVASGSKTGNYGAMSNGTGAFVITGFQYGYPSSGLLDEYALWNKALTQSEVSEVYNYGRPTDLSTTSMSSSLRNWWRMGEYPESAGSQILDIIGSFNSYTTTLASPDTNVPGRSNYSIDLDGPSTLTGSNEHVSIADSNSLSFTSAGQDQPFSISTWAYIDEATDFEIFSKGNDASREYVFDTRGVGTDRLRLSLQDPAGNNYIDVYATSALTSYQGQWVHLAATYSGSESASGIKLYLNGSLLTTATALGGSYTGMTNGTGSARIGSIFGNANYYADGKIDEFSLWNKELSQAEITELVASGSPTMLGAHSAYSNLVSWWDFENAFSDYLTINGPTLNSVNAYDKKGSNNGTYTNMEYNSNPSDIVASTPSPIITRDTSTTYLSSSGSVKIVNSAISGYNFTQNVTIGDTDSYNLVGYAYTTGAAVTSADVQMYANGSALTTTYTSVGSGWYKMSATVTGTASSIAYGAQIKSGKTVYLDNMSLSNYEPSGTLISNIFDTEQASAWGTVTYDTGNTYSVSLDGVNEYIQIPDNAAYSFGSGPFTISGWTKVSDPYGWLFAKYANNGYANEWSLSCNAWTCGSLQWIIYGNYPAYLYMNSTSVTGYNLTSGNNWVHVAGTYDGSGSASGLKIYINGDDVSGSTGSNGTYTTLQESSTPIRMGYAPASSHNYNAGNFDDFSVWGTALSQQQIREIYNAGAPADLSTHSAYSDLISWWTFGDNASDDLTGSTGTVRDEMGVSHGYGVSTESTDKVPVVANDNTVVIKIRTGSQSDMSDAVDWATCTAITSGADISDNNCVDDGDRYIQYQVSLATSNVLYTPSLNDISVEYELGGITVATSGTQRSTLATPSVNQNIGGAFTITKPGAIPATITSITIDETGTIDGADLENATLYYKEQATCTDFIPATAEVFGTVASFTGETAVFTGSMPIDSDQTCMYIQFDVADTATNGETIELQITDPSTDVVSVGESITPATAVAIAGTTTLGVASSESSSTLEVTTIDGCTITFSLSGETLIMTEAGGGACPSGTNNLTSNRVRVTDLEFTELTSVDGEKTIQIEMTLTDVSTNERREFTFEQDFATSVTIR